MPGTNTCLPRNIDAAPAELSSTRSPHYGRVRVYSRQTTPPPSLSMTSKTPFVVNHDGKKHNIEHFLRFHPGGTNTLSVLRNADVTDRLLATHHSAAAYELLKDYRVDEGDEHKYLREDGDLEVSHLCIIQKSPVYINLFLKIIPY